MSFHQRVMVEKLVHESTPTHAVHWNSCPGFLELPFADSACFAGHLVISILSLLFLEFIVSLYNMSVVALYVKL